MGSTMEDLQFDIPDAGLAGDGEIWLSLSRQVPGRPIHLYISGDEAQPVGVYLSLDDAARIAAWLRAARPVVSEACRYVDGILVSGCSGG